MGSPVPVVDGIAEFEHTFDEDGTYTVTAQFIGAEQFQDSASNALTVEVGADSTDPGNGDGGTGSLRIGSLQSLLSLFGFGSLSGS